MYCFGWRSGLDRGRAPGDGIELGADARFVVSAGDRRFGLFNEEALPGVGAVDELPERAVQNARLIALPADDRVEPVIEEAVLVDGPLDDLSELVVKHS